MQEPLVMMGGLGVGFGRQLLWCCSGQVVSSDGVLWKGLMGVLGNKGRQ